MKKLREGKNKQKKGKTKGKEERKNRRKKEGTCGLKERKETEERKTEGKKISMKTF